MIHFNYSFKSLSGGLLLSLCFVMPLHAEDIKIYTNLGPGAASVQPNVLFVLDTSGSMDTEITVSVAYDPATVYADNGCGTDRVYWSTSGTPPGCGSGRYFHRSALNCDHAVKEYDGAGNIISADGPLLAEGFYLGNMAQKRGNDWRSIRTTRNGHRSRSIECEEDRGIHGSNSAPVPSAYIQNDNSNAWSSSQTVSGWPGESYTIYSSNYINFLADGGGTRVITRFQAVKEAMESIVTASNNINIGLMGFNGKRNWWESSSSPNNDGGQVLFAMEDVDTARQPFIDFILHPDFNTNSWTPLSETYFEAIHYFAGKTPPYGTAPNANPSSVTASIEADGSYLSPITIECQANHIVFLTDGDPTRDTLSTTQLTSLPGFTDTSCASTVETTVEGDQAIIESNCLDRLSGWAFNHDVAVEAGAAHEGKQNIITNTIGFGDGLSVHAVAMLERTATAGGGAYYEAQNPNELVGKFNKIISDALKQNTTFSAPSVSVNAFNRSTHLNDLYFTLFKPSIGAHWPGNLKKYKLKFKADANDATVKKPFIADVNDRSAINAATGFFDTSSKSFWSDLVDGNEVTEGGAANEFQDLSPGPRKVYTFTGTYIVTDGVSKPAANATLTATANRVESTNTNIKDDVTMLDIGINPPDKITGTPRRETLLNWAAGFDVFNRSGAAGTTDMRPGMGSPLHSQPALVEYGTETASKMVAFVATNDGYLHAFDTDDIAGGKELFSFIPQELLSNLNVLMDDDTSNKVYGLDGDVVAWVNDKDNDGINSTEGDHVYLYIGMRRGGNNIYSVDVTNPDAPSLRWVIKGGVGAYAELGQTWSAVNVGKIKDGTTEKTVLIFGGGYDTNQDTATVITADSVGRAVFIANADTGALLWSAGPVGTAAHTEIPEMNYSIPARITVLDMSGDGLIDRLYAADMGGQVLRFDINNQTGTLASSIKGGRIANLAGTLAKDARRFYYPPDVALIAERGKKAYLALGITSGYRAHPLNTDIHDRIYLLKDENIYNTPDPFVTLTEINLYDATLNHAGDDGNQTQKDDAVAALANTDGWRINLDDPATNTWKGEKGLSEAMFLEGTLIVTTYVPPDGTAVTNACTAGASGTGKVYFLDVLDGTPAFNKTSDLRAARHGSLKKEGIPPVPRLIITKDGIAVTVGTEFVDAEGIQGVRKTFWHEVER